MRNFKLVFLLLLCFTQTASAQVTWQSRSSLLQIETGSGWQKDGNFVHLYQISDSVGIGTTSPDAHLEVESSATASFNLKSTATNGSALLSMLNDAQNWRFHLTSGDKLALQDWTNTTNVFLLDPGSMANAFVVTSDAVGIGATPNANTALHVQTTNSGGQTFRIDRDDDGALGPISILNLASDSPADGDVLGNLQFRGNDDGAVNSVFGRIYATSDDVTNSTKDGSIIIATLKDGSEQTATFHGGDLTLTDGSTATASIFTSTGNFLLDATGELTSAIQLETTVGNLTPSFETYYNDPSPNSQPIFNWDFDAEDSGGNKTTFAHMAAGVSDVTNGSEDGYFRFRSLVDNSNEDAYIRGSTMEADDFQGASRDCVLVSQRTGIGAVPDAISTFYVYNNAVAGPVIRFVSDQNSTVGSILQFFLDTESPAVDDVVGSLQFISNNASAGIETYGYIYTKIENLTAGNEDATLVIASMVSGSSTDIAQFDSNGVSIDHGGLVVGGPTDGFRGTGTINAEEIYDDGVIVSDFVFTEVYQESLFTIKEMADFTKRYSHLPTIDGKATWELKGKPSLGRLSSQLYETVEVQALYIIDLEKRLSTLEEKLKQLKLN